MFVRWKGYWEVEFESISFGDEEFELENIGVVIDIGIFLIVMLIDVVELFNKEWVVLCLYFEVCWFKFGGLVLRNFGMDNILLIVVLFFFFLCLFLFLGVRIISLLVMIIFLMLVVFVFFFLLEWIFLFLLVFFGLLVMWVNMLYVYILKLILFNRCFCVSIILYMILVRMLWVLLS